MFRIIRKLLFLVPAILLLLADSASTFAQLSFPTPRSRILQPVEESRRTTLAGNTHPMARAEFDQGAMADAAPLRSMVLILQRGPEQEVELQRLLDQQQDRNSSTYHQWLTPESFGATFGPSDRDLSSITTWLSGHGFGDVRVNSGRTLIEFSGTAGMVRTAFRTNMHRYVIRGEQHFANASDPQIPLALAPVVSGIASLNDFGHRAASRRVGSFRHDAAANLTTRLPEQATSKGRPAFTIASGANTLYGVTPYDFATIYNVLPLWNASTPIDGTGQTIAIVGQTDINPADFVNFRKLFSLPLGNTATPTGTEYLNIIYNGPNPGVTADEGEADIDTQWSAAVAKGATIDYVVSEGTEVTQGTDLSAIYIIDNNLAPVMSYSYGQCELFLGSTGNAFYKALWQQAAAQGISVLIASGDSGAAGCDTADDTGASYGLGVNGLGSTPYNISVGGTDFYMPQGGTAFWNGINSSTTQASAKGYIPEVPWNESCTNTVFATSRFFSGQTTEQICNTGVALTDGLLSVVGGGGGASSCTQSNGSSPLSCKGYYSKPSWQMAAGVPSDGVRDIPDVSFFAGAGFFGVFYVVCQQSTNADGRPCNLAAPTYDFAGYGGTSVATPAFAGILSLINQKTGSRQGNANYVLYNLASQQQKAGKICSAISGIPAAGCVFNDITTDTIAMPCLKGSPNCTVTNSADRYGVLSGYNSGAGYDFTTGLGSVNAANLVNNWTNANFTASSTTLTLSPSTIPHGSPVSAVVNVTSVAGTPTGNVSVNALTANGSVQTGTLHNGSYSAPLSSFPGGSYSVQAHYSGDGVYAPSDSNAVALTVSPEDSTTSLQPLLYNPANGAVTPVQSGSTYPYGGFFLIRAEVAGVSGQGLATGNIMLTDSGLALDGGIFRLNAASNTEDQTRSLSPGTHVLTTAYSGDASFNPSQSPPFAFTIVKTQTDSLLQTNAGYVSAGTTVTLTAQINALGFATGGLGGFGAAAPGGTVTFTAGGLTLGNAVVAQNAYPAFTTDSGLVNFSFPASQLSAGNNTITASYSGDINYQPSSSTPVGVYVTASSLGLSTTALSLSSASIVPGDSFVFSATVSPNSPLPTGTVVFLSDNQVVSKPLPLSSGTVSASSQVITITPGSHLITALYSGDATHQASVSAPASFTIGAALPSIATISVSPATVEQGAAVTVATTISPASPIPGGVTQLLLDGNPYGQSVPLTSTTTILPLLTNTLQSGAHVLQVNYSGDKNHSASTSAAATLTVIAPTGTFTLSPLTSSTTMAEGKSSNAITLTVAPVGGFHSVIMFACTGGLPAGATCLFSPASITPTNSTPRTTVLTISSTALSSRTVEPSTSHDLVPVLGVACAGLIVFMVPGRGTRRWGAFALLALSTLGVLSGCGSGGVDPNAAKPLSTGSYAVTVRATGGSTIQTAAINLTIQ
ncbi:Ig-like domain repeat protein [Tunturiibacter gelidoferens]|uniref:Subtilase family serine protease n=1 Tax=Tunturiibacter gelidiferens TaxID=3069689 RepID=A0ACC5NXS2_9BACT|nr:Ig-like domain repeat protein [Edaphobacter lichenicola]MBB5339153.1 subtilase family serine protease [Edaphobacter lichenicola]